jgi:hypothetical protein
MKYFHCILLVFSNFWLEKVDLKKNSFGSTFSSAPPPLHPVPLLVIHKVVHIQHRLRSHGRRRRPEPCLIVLLRPGERTRRFGHEEDVLVLALDIAQHHGLALFQLSGGCVQGEDLLRCQDHVLHCDLALKSVYANFCKCHRLAQIRCFFVLFKLLQA